MVGSSGRLISVDNGMPLCAVCNKWNNVKSKAIDILPWTMANRWLVPRSMCNSNLKWVFCKIYEPFHQKRTLSYIVGIGRVIGKGCMVDARVYQWSLPGANVFASRDSWLLYNEHLATKFFFNLLLRGSYIFL